MTITLNGTKHDGGGAATVGELLRALGLDGRPVLVERNGTALLPGERDATPLDEGDRLELVELAAGG